MNGSETAVFQEFSVDGEQYPLEELGTPVTASEAKIMDVAPGVSRKVTVGTAFEAVRLPRTVQVVWEGGYEEAIPVTWHPEGYDGQTVGTCTVTGTLEGIRETAYGTEERPAVQVIVTADKTNLEEAISRAEGKLEAAYTEESWSALEEVLEEARGILGNDGASQEETNAIAEKLEEKADQLQLAVTYSGLKEILASAEKLAEETAGTLYEETQPEGERLNGFYSAAEREGLLDEVQKTADMLALWAELEEIGNVDDLLTEEEKIQLTETGQGLIESLEAFQNSQVKVSTEDLEVLLEDASQLQEHNFTETTWNALQEVIGKAENTLRSGSYSQNTVLLLEKELTETIDLLKKVFVLQINDAEGGTVTADVESPVEEGSTVTIPGLFPRSRL